MKINKVTMTGADDSTDPKKLVLLSKKYPFVEWGILLSRRSVGNNRFPSLNWMNNFAELVRAESLDVMLSGHLCGTYVNEVLTGSGRCTEEVGKLWQLFKRLQINTHGAKHQFDRDAFDLMKGFQKQIIFQYDSANTVMMNLALNAGVNGSALYDMSHGAGVLPKAWLEPINGVYCGYAGGLSPDNIKEQLELIESKVGDNTIWIDMETHVRSSDDSVFDLEKVVSVLEICEKSGLIKK
jgi:hypothetical protein